MNTMEKQNQLKKLGLTEKEAKLYVNALELGSFSVMGISHKSGIKRPTCYLVLDELVKKGLISIIPRAKKVLYTAEPPEVLIKQVEEQFSLTKSLVPKLNAFYRTDKEKRTVKYYSGQKSIRNIYEDVLKVKPKEYYYIGSAKELEEITGKEFLNNWIKKRIQLGIKSISIRMRETEITSKNYQDKDGSLREIRYAPKEIYIPDTLIIYGAKVATISTTKGNFGFVVEDKEFSESMMGLFKSLWKISE